MLAIPNQTPGLLAEVNLTRTEVDRSVWVIAPSGERWSGAAAVNRVLAELGGGWRWLSYVYAVPPIAWVEELGYRWVARNRGRLAQWWGATPECEFVDCLPENDSPFV